jgi:predicted nucleic acid-binding protein
VKYFLLDASALTKRYANEPGTALVDYLFSHVAHRRLLSLMLGIAEVAATLARKRNSGLITPAAFSSAMSQLWRELIDAPEVTKLSADNPRINSSIPFSSIYAINATDALVLYLAVTLANQLRAIGNDLVLVASDQRLLKAAQAEGLLTFDPETETEAVLDALLAV